METSELSLKEKWKVHYANRDFSRKPSFFYKMGIVYFWIMLLSLAIEAHRLLIPMHCRYTRQSIFLWKLSLWFVFCQIVVNWMYSCFNDVSYVKNGSLERLVAEQNLKNTPEGWTNCPKCQLDAPPRSHHCPICGRCVMKRDQHCFFTGSCIGFYNQRYMIVLSLYGIIGCAIVFFLQLSYLNDIYPIRSSYGYTYIPVVALWQFFVKRAMSGAVFALLAHAYLCLITLTFTLLAFMWQMFIIFRGQTTYEAWKNIKPYQIGVLEHLRQIFGPWWLLNLIFPSRTWHVGNGMQWETKPRFKFN